MLADGDAAVLECVGRSIAGRHAHARQRRLSRCGRRQQRHRNRRGGCHQHRADAASPAGQGSHWDSHGPGGANVHLDGPGHAGSSTDGPGHAGSRADGAPCGNRA